MPNARRPRLCEVCSAQYQPTYHEQRTCGRICGAQINSHVRAMQAKAKPLACPLNWRDCVTCGVLLYRGRAATCGRDCELERARRRFSEQWVSKAQPTTIPCQDCGEDYTTKTTTNSGVCKRCQRRRAKAAFCTSDRGRARRYGVKYEPVDRRKVYERDRWRCQLCGKAVRRDVKAPHPLSPSLDHIVPMSLGGDHLYANTQCAHFLCNSLKGVGGSQQLALIG